MEGVKGMHTKFTDNTKLGAFTNIQKEMGKIQKDFAQNSGWKQMK